MAFDRFRRRKKEEEKTVIKEGTSSLEKLSGTEELYKDLSALLPLDPVCFHIPENPDFHIPENSDPSPKDMGNYAEELEKKGDIQRARINYRMAFVLALWKGTEAEVKEYYAGWIRTSPGAKGDDSYMSNINGAKQYVTGFYTKRLEEKKAKKESERFS